MVKKFNYYQIREIRQYIDDLCEFKLSRSDHVNEQNPS